MRQRPLTQHGCSCPYQPIRLASAKNCFDAAPRYKPDDVRIALDLDPEVPVVLCDARQRDSVKRVLITLVRYVISLSATDLESAGVS